MQNQTLGIILIVAAVLVGFALGLWQSKTRSQRAAVSAAFVSLGLIVALFCYVVVIQGNRETAVTALFVVGCMVVPSALYFVVGRMVPDAPRGKTAEVASQTESAGKKKEGRRGPAGRRAKEAASAAATPAPAATQTTPAPAATQATPAPARPAPPAAQATPTPPAAAAPAAQASRATAPVPAPSAPAPAPVSESAAATSGSARVPARPAVAPAPAPAVQEAPAGSAPAPSRPPVQQSRPATMQPLPESRLDTLGWNKKRADGDEGSPSETDAPRAAAPRQAAPTPRPAVVEDASSEPSRRPSESAGDPMEERRRAALRQAEQARIAAERRAAAEKAAAERAARSAAASAAATGHAVEQRAAASGFDPERYFTRATLLRDRGLFSAAAKLYAECASLTQDRQVFCRASIEQIACYVKGGMPEQARELAEDLKANASDLTMSERIKVDAVLKLAEQA